MQIEVGCEAARGTEKPEKLGFIIGFLLGQEAIWLSESLRILCEEAPDVEITLMTKSSSELADGLMQGKIDVALLRRETQTWTFEFLSRTPLRCSRDFWLSPRVSAIGSMLAILMFLTTLSFLGSTRGWGPGLGGFPALAVVPGHSC